MILLTEFVHESNRIEGINGVHPDHLQAHEELLALDKLTVKNVERFVFLVQPNAILRRRVGLNVRVGAHIAPPGGPEIEPALEGILGSCNYVKALGDEFPEVSAILAARESHKEYENLHPFSDGNGRSGRAIWLWMRGGDTGRGFLREWTRAREPQRLNFHALRQLYYASLQAPRG